MRPEVTIIGRPGVDFDTFLGVAMKVIGRSPSASADASGIQLSDTSRFLSCLASVSDAKAKVELNQKFLPHAAFSLLTILDEEDILGVLECASGMSFVTTETLVRHVYMLVITGTLSQWKAAVVAGSSTSTIESSVRYLFNKIQGLFQAEGINMWTDYRQKQSSDQVTFLLEDKRGR